MTTWQLKKSCGKAFMFPTRCPKCIQFSYSYVHLGLHSAGTLFLHDYKRSFIRPQILESYTIPCMTTLQLKKSCGKAFMLPTRCPKCVQFVKFLCTLRVTFIKHTVIARLKNCHSLGHKFSNRPRYHLWRLDNLKRLAAKHLCCQQGAQSAYNLLHSYVH